MARRAVQWSLLTYEIRLVPASGSCIVGQKGQIGIGDSNLVVGRWDCKRFRQLTMKKQDANFFRRSGNA